MVLHHGRGKAGMNLLEVPIMFWPLIELFWVLYFVGGLDFKISKSTWIHYKSKLLQKQAPYISIMLNPHQSGWQIRITKVLLWCWEIIYIWGMFSCFVKRLVSPRNTGSINAVQGTVTKRLRANQKHRLLST